MKYVPSRSDWAVAAPADAGIDPAKLDEAIAFHKANETAWPRDVLKHLETGHFEPPPWNEIIGPTRDRTGPNGVVLRGGRIVAEDTPDQLSARLRHSEKVSVTIKTPPDDCLARLRSISGILNVFPGQHAGNFLLECALGQDKRDEIARYIIANQWGLLELRTISMTLEDVFLQLTRHEEGLTSQAETVSALPGTTQETAP